jgi:hypothetical protein
VTAERSPLAPRRVAIVVSAALVACVAALWTTRAQEGARWLGRARGAEARGEHGLAIEQARAAALARCPACAAPRDAEALLEHIAREAERRGDDATAIGAWRAIRAAELSAMGARSAMRARSDAELARLMHRQEAAAATPGAPTPAASSEAALKAAHEADPSRAGAHGLVAAGAAAWLWALLRLRRGGAVVTSAAVGALAVGAAFFALWML